ncbi:MAG: ATP-binding protein, partial [Vicinamibacteria bacterium]|nr:ATP-binding protein [Vicinamibacteria bacterium]
RTASLRERESELTRRVAERTQELQHEVADRTQAEEGFRHLADILDESVKERTAELEAAKASLERDIAIRQETEAALSAEKERLAVTLRSIGDGVIATDVERRVMLMNRVAESLTGWTQGEACGRPMSDVFRIVDRWTRQPLPDPLDHVLRVGTAIELTAQAMLLARDGQERLIADSAAPICDRDSHVTGAVLVFRDITERRRLEEHLAKAGKLESIGILAAGIAHDFNNLLMGVFGFVDLARTETPRDGSAWLRLTKAIEALDRARGLASQLLTFTASGLPVTAPTDIGLLLRHGVSFTLAGSKLVSALDVPSDLWWCDLDAAQISQVIENLLINARQAMPSGGCIEVQASNVLLDADPLLPDGRYVKFIIHDHGAGIRAEHRSRIFDPFFTTKPGGTGLGLATAHSIIKRHRGHIEFESVEGEGTSFSVYLPVASQGTLHRAEVVDTPVHLHGRVLVMDDEQVVRDVLSESLQVFGLDVVAVANGAAAVAAFQAALTAGAPFDLVILDLTIAGGMGGVETLAQLRELQPSVRAIASSGYSIDPVIADPTRFGFRGVLTKPYTIIQLRRTVAAFLSQARARP